MKISNTANIEQNIQSVSKKPRALQYSGSSKTSDNASPKTSPNTIERVEFNDKAIALLEQQNAANTEHNYVASDQPSEQNQHAVNAYQNVNNLAERENIQAMLGVDLFA